MSDGQRNGASESAVKPDEPRPAEQSLGLEDVRFDEEDRATLPFKDKQTAPQTQGIIEVKVVGRTDVGLVREHNEDNFLLADLATGSRDASTFHEVPKEGLVLAVCDGMGGAAAGEVASQLAVDTLFEMMKQSVPATDHDTFARGLVRAIEEAGSRIFEAARADRSRRGMGTTSTVAALMDKVLFVGQVGDSRAYVLRRGELKQITKDQSLVNQLIEAGQLTADEAEAFEHSNIILQALGTTENVMVDLTFLELRRGDRLMMCSDGLSGLVHADVIREVMTEYRDLGGCCERLIELAKSGGGHDNVTVLLCEFGGDGLNLPQPSEGPAYQQYLLPGEGDSAGDDDERSSSYTPTGSGELARGVLNSLQEAQNARASSRARYWVAIVLLLAAAGAFFVWRGLGVRPSTGIGTRANAEPVAIAPLAAPRVEVVVRTTLPAHDLLVNGTIVAGRPSEGRWTIDLPPGEHRFEARLGGVPHSMAQVEIREGVPATVMLAPSEGVSLALDGGADEQAQERGDIEPERQDQPAPKAIGKRPAVGTADSE